MSEENKTPVETSVLERLIRIEVLLDTHFTELSRRLSDHETRIRAQERWSYAAPIAILIALGSAATAVIRAFGG